MFLTGYGLSITVKNTRLVFKQLNDNKRLNHKIKPFNFITVGMGYRTDIKTKEPIIPVLPFVNSKRSKEIPYMEFIDYKTGIRYSNATVLDTQSYWKPLTLVFQDYFVHKESKSDGWIGLLGRKRITINELLITILVMRLTR